MTTATKTTVLGEFGIPGHGVYQIVLPAKRGNWGEIRRLWRLLDTCEPSEQLGIIAKIRHLGGVAEEN